MKWKYTIDTSNCRSYQAMNCILCCFIFQTVSNHKTFRYVRAGMTLLWRGMGVGCSKGILNLFPRSLGIVKIKCCFGIIFLLSEAFSPVPWPDTTCCLFPVANLSHLAAWRKNRIHLLELYTYINSWPELKENQNNNFTDKMLNHWKGQLLIKLII